MAQDARALRGRLRSRPQRRRKAIERRLSGIQRRAQTAREIRAERNNAHRRKQPIEGAHAMLSVEEARAKARRCYEKRYPAWAVRMIAEALQQADDVACASDRWEIGLKPPTEKEVLQDHLQAHAWANSWRRAAETFSVRFTERSWPSVGTQHVPLKLTLTGAGEIASFAECARHWETCLQRTKAFITKLVAPRDHAAHALSPADFARFERHVSTLVSLPEDDWQRLCDVLRWLQNHPAVALFARELPVRGVDSKWVEHHNRLVWDLGEALTGQPVHIRLKAPTQFRVRLLDERRSACGLRDFAASADELAHLSDPPHTVIICENLVSLLTLPPFSEALGMHGAGYAVGDVASIPWLQQARVLYWGDLDSHGFAILNRLRSHLPHAESVLMDPATLRAHLDLCVSDPTPTTAQFDHLTALEREALSALLSHDQPLRLEQERIPYSFCCKTLQKAMGACRV
ncbi:hypothetical protein GMI69_03505 [Eggerthellaceae bacterium zg-887]|nr:hypothetical protein [Xiamenia xianingshaonis]